MDTEVVKTFIEVASSGSFGNAAKRLNVAQTTVSARIKKLEEVLGRQLLIRQKSGAVLTQSGEHFLRQAPAFVQLGEQLRNDLALPSGFSTVLRLGGELSVASTWMNRWTRRLTDEMPETLLRIKIDIAADLPNRFSEGLLDAALMHTPPKREGLQIDLLIEDRLMLFTTDPRVRSVYDPRFVYVDWGEDFSAAFRQSYPKFQGAPVSFDCGPLAGEYILAKNGIAYGRQRSAHPFLKTGQLSLIEEAVAFSYPVYIVRPAGIPNPTLDRAVAVLRKILSSPT